jgi:hypothetical protein
VTKSRVLFAALYFLVTPLFVGLLLVLVFGFSEKKDEGVVVVREDSKIREEPVIGEARDKFEVEQAGVVLGADARPILLKEYLLKYKSPLADYSDLIFELSQKYGIDYRLIVAIAQQESNLCKKMPPDCYNCWGYGIHSRGTMCFENYQVALESYAAYLKREYFDKGYKTVEEIMEKYAPHSDGSWAFGVNQFLDDIEKR